MFMKKVSPSCQAPVPGIRRPKPNPTTAKVVQNNFENSNDGSSGSRPKSKAKRDMTMPEFKKGLEILMEKLDWKLATAPTSHADAVPLYRPRDDICHGDNGNLAKSI
jgi:hypothetical protein